MTLSNLPVSSPLFVFFLQYRVFTSFTLSSIYRFCTYPDVAKNQTSSAESSCDSRSFTVTTASHDQLGLTSVSISFFTKIALSLHPRHAMIHISFFLCHTPNVMKTEQYDVRNSHSFALSRSVRSSPQWLQPIASSPPSGLYQCKDHLCSFS